MIERIIKCIREERLRISDHADEEACNDNLTYEEIFTSVLRGEVIEEYPESKPYPAYLIYGNNFKNEPIHSVWAYNKEKEAGILITVYRPDPKQWIGFRRRIK